MIIPKEIKQKPLEYIILSLLLMAGFLIYILIGNNHIRRWIIYFSGISYFGWSLYHHYKRGDFQLSIVIEYLLIILLGIAFISGTLF